MKTKKANMFKRELVKFIGLSAVWMGTLAFSQMSFAQSNLAPSIVMGEEGSGHSGGGNITEADLRYYMGKLETYFSSEESKTVFPEIVAYDATHPTESFKQLISNTHPVVQKDELKDANGVVRDCMSFANPGHRYFVCNSDALPNKTLENQPSFYRIVLHELMVQAGIEKPLSKDVPSVYEVSSRITTNVHLETYQEWVPGKAGESIIRNQGFICQSSDVTFRRRGKSKGLIVHPDGSYWFYQFKFNLVFNNSFNKDSKNSKDSNLLIDELRLISSGKISFLNPTEMIDSDFKVVTSGQEDIGNPHFSVIASVSESYLDQNYHLNHNSGFEVNVYSDFLRVIKKEKGEVFTYDDLDQSNFSMKCGIGNESTLNYRWYSKAEETLGQLIAKTKNSKYPYTH